MGTDPATALFEASLSVMVTVEVAIPSATTGVVPEMLEFPATAAPAVNITVPPALTTGVAIERVLVSALVEASEHVETPLASELEHVSIELVDPVSVAVKVGTEPETPLLFISLRVMVMVEEEVPSATTGPVPEIVEVAATGLPAVKTTVPSAFTTGVAIERVLVSALVEESVQVEIPEASVAEHVL